MPASEPQHDREQRVVDADEDRGCEQSGQRKRGVVAGTDSSGDDPGTESAERVVREVEDLDVPGGLIGSRPQRQMEREDESDDQCRRQHERAGDDERGPGMKAVISADRDAKARGEGCERKQQRERHPLGPRRCGADHRGGRSHHRSEADGGRVGGRVPRQRTEASRPPPGWLGHRLCALPHLVTVLRQPAPRGEY